MKMFKLLLLFVLVFSESRCEDVTQFWKNLGRLTLSEENPKREYPDQWKNQILDHFNPSDTRTWPQRYFVNDQFISNERNVAFLDVGGEDGVSTYWMEHGLWVDSGKQHGAILFILEHRFYGKSHPTEDMSVENLRFLNSQQALGDVAEFIKDMNGKYNLARNVKWILFGGSYSGSLAAWARLKYPHLVQGAVSASAPLLAKLNFQDYHKVVANDFRAISDVCVNNIQAGFAQIQSIIENKGGDRNITKLFHLCKDIEAGDDSPLDIANFFTSVIHSFGRTAQYQHLGDMSLQLACAYMMTPQLPTPVDKVVTIHGHYHNLSASSECTDYSYKNNVEATRESGWISRVSGGTRQWAWQTCTEFGFYQTTDAQPQVFGNKVPLEYYVQRCIDIFGDKYNKEFLERAIDRTNTIYGALDIQVSNVVHVQGSVDPWYPLGIRRTLHAEAPAILITGASHCEVLYETKPQDIPSLKPAREQIKQLISSWLLQK